MLQSCYPTYSRSVLALFLNRNCLIPGLWLPHQSPCSFEICTPGSHVYQADKNCNEFKSCSWVAPKIIDWWYWQLTSGQNWFVLPWPFLNGLVPDGTTITATMQYNVGYEISATFDIQLPYSNWRIKCNHVVITCILSCGSQCLLYPVNFF